MASRVPRISLKAKAKKYELYLGYKQPVKKDLHKSTITFEPKGIWKHRGDVPEDLLVQIIETDAEGSYLHVVYFLYSHGDSLGFTEDWGILDAHETLQTAKNAAAKAKPQLEKNYNDYFGNLQAIKIYSTRVREHERPDATITAWQE